MKQATGELNMTLVTVNIIAVFILGLTVIVPTIIKNANNTWAEQNENTGVNFGIQGEAY